MNNYMEFENNYGLSISRNYVQGTLHFDSSDNGLGVDYKLDDNAFANLLVFFSEFNAKSKSVISSKVMLNDAIGLRAELEQTDSDGEYFLFRIFDDWHTTQVSLEKFDILNFIQKFK